MGNWHRQMWALHISSSLKALCGGWAGCRHSQNNQSALQTSSGLLPFSHCWRLEYTLCADRFPGCPVEQSHTCVQLLTILKLSIIRLGPSSASPRASIPVCLRPVEISVCAHWTCGLHRFFNCLLFFHGQILSRVIATADGACYFLMSQVHCGVECWEDFFKEKKN